MTRRRKATHNARTYEEPKLLQKASWKDLALAGGVAGLALILLLANLGNQYLWQDEAETALIAKTILKYGVPRGYDGKNFFSQDGGANYGRGYLWRLHPWLQFYVTAVFFALFGVGTLTARLPFVLFGAGTVALCYFFAKSLWGSRRAGTIAALLLTTNVPFLILARQCRYYSASAFFSVAALYAYHEFTARRRRAGLFFGCAAILLFHTQYTQCAALLAAVLVHAAIFQRERLVPLAKIAGVVLLVCLPWAIWFSAASKIEKPGIPFAEMTYLFAKKYFYLLRRHVASPISLCVLAAVWIGTWVRHRYPWAFDTGTRTRVALLLLFGLCSTGISSIAAPAPFFRYLAPIIPVWFVLAGLFIESAFKTHAAVGVLAAVAMVIPVAQGRMTDYFYEITHDYDGPTEGIVKYLKKHAKRDDVVAITYGDLTVKFYTDLRVVGGLTGEDLTPAKTADWVIVRKWLVSDKDRAVRQFILSQVPLRDYDMIRIPYPDTVYENREEPDEHLFRTNTNEDGVVIFRKRRT